MAVYHFNARIVSRRTRSVLAVAAYYASETLRDRSGTAFGYGVRRSPEWSGILAPEGAPPWAFQREELWNRAEEAESRADAQLARLVTLCLPCELSVDQRSALVREYVHANFVSLGMVADMNVRQDRIGNPFAVCLLTLRRVSADGFSAKKAREWNARKLLVGWRRDWASLTNHHLEHAGYRVRVDERSHAERGIGLLPEVKVWVPRERRNPEKLPAYHAELVRENQRRAAYNAELIARNPGVAIHVLRQARECFREAEIRAFLRKWVRDSALVDATHHALMTSGQLQPVGTDETGAALFR